MGQESRLRLSESEWRVMEVLWEGPATLMELVRALHERAGWAKSTVTTMVRRMEEKGLIRTEPSTITTKDGRVRNGSLIYTIRPIQEALELNYQRQFLQVERDMERARAEKRLAELNQQNKKGEESA